MAGQDGIQRDGPELMVFHHHSPVHNQGFHASGSAEHQGCRHIFSAAVTHVAEIEQRDVRALARGETSNVVAAETRRASQVAMRSASRAFSAAAPCARRLSNNAWRASASMWELSLEALPSTPRPTGEPARRSARAGAMPEPSRMLELGQCATPTRARPRRLTSRELK